MKRTSRHLFIVAAACGLVAAGAPSSAMAAAHTVHPGESIQAAVDAANPGDTVKVLPGDYTETHGNVVAVHVTKSLKLLALSKPTAKVRLLPGANNLQGILVEPANPGDPDINGLIVSGFTVQGFPKNGIWLRHVQHYKIQNNQAIDNLENGIWPTLSANGLVKKNVSYGSEDSALWIEASENVRAIKNELHHSPTGLEITVSHNITATKNDIHDNSVGVGLYHPSAAGLPPLQPLDQNGYWTLIKNHVHDNNNPNAAPAGSMSAALPPGIGILVLGVDHVTLKANTVTGNQFFGIGVLDWCLAVAGTDFDCSIAVPEVSDTAPDHDTAIANVATGNGTVAPPGFDAFKGDIFAVGGTGNCFIHNTAVVIPFPLPTTCS
jgi:hypothetical protein